MVDRLRIAGGTGFFISRSTKARSGGMAGEKA